MSLRERDILLSTWRDIGKIFKGKRKKLEREQTFYRRVKGKNPASFAVAESVVQIVALAEDLINGVDQFIVIEAFELGFVDNRDYSGNDAQNVYRFVIAAVGPGRERRIHPPCGLRYPELKTDRIPVPDRYGTIQDFNP